MGLVIGILVFGVIMVSAIILNLLITGETLLGPIPAVLAMFFAWWFGAVARKKYNVWRGISEPDKETDNIG